MSNNYCYTKDGEAIIIWEAIRKSSLLFYCNILKNSLLIALLCILGRRQKATLKKNKCTTISVYHYETSDGWSIYNSLIFC